MASRPRFCGRCGGQVAPGAPFCGACGAPQSVAPPVPAPVAPPAPPPIPAPVAQPAPAPGYAVPGYAYPPAPAYAYAYAPAPPAATAGGFKLSHVLIAGGLLLMLVIATVTVSALTVARELAAAPTCKVDCGPRVGRSLTTGVTYHSQAYGYEVDYSSDWDVRSQSTAGISLGTQRGRIDVSGTNRKESLDAAISDAVSALPSSTWQGVTKLGDINGAHIGDQDGRGYLYSANLVGSNSTASKVRFAVIAAARGGVTVVVFAVNPFEQKASPSGMPEAQDFDALLAEFRWP